MNVPAALLLLVALVAFMLAQGVLVRLRGHRIDVRPGEGKPRIWPMSVVAPSLYDAAGRRLLVRLWILHVVWVACFLTAWVLMRTWERFVR